jgi:hypothetical protein
MEGLRGRWIVRQPSSGTRLRSPGRLQHNVCSDPPGASHIPARTGRKLQRRGGRTARRTANRGSSAPHSIRRLRHNQCRYARNPADFRRCKHLRNGGIPPRMSGRLRYSHDAFHDGETYLSTSSWLNWPPARLRSLTPPFWRSSSRQLTRI